MSIYHMYYYLIWYDTTSTKITRWEKEREEERKSELEGEGERERERREREKKIEREREREKYTGIKPKVCNYHCCWFVVPLYLHLFQQIWIYEWMNEWMNNWCNFVVFLTSVEYQRKW